MTVYDEEQKKMEQPARGSAGGGDYSWLEMDKPANVGAKTHRNVRVVQRLVWVDGQPDPARPYPEFWMRVSVHRGNVDSKWWMGVCPENRDIEGWRDRATCPICLLQKELWATKREDYDKVAKDIAARWRVYCNVIDFDDINGHWADDGQGGWTVRPKIYGYSKSIHNDMMSLCVHTGPIEDHATGRPLVLECERTGPDKLNIKYRVTPKDREPVPEQLMPIVWGAYDLEGLGKPATMEELRKAAQTFDPRAGSAATGYTAPPSTVHHAPPPSYPGTAAPPTAVPGGYQPPPPAGPPAAAAPSSYAPQGGYAVGAPPPPPPLPPPPGTPRPPPAAPPPPQAPAKIYHYAGPSGQFEGLSGADVARYIAADPGGQHHVWAAGMAGWEPAANQPDIVPPVIRGGTQGGPPGGPPRGPPRPPGPPGGASF
jgi:hypothetical protein